MSNRFTERAQRIILVAQEEAKRLKHDYVGPEHILLGMIAIGEGVAAQVLANLDMDLSKVRVAVEDLVGYGTHVMLLGEIPFTPRAKKVLEYSVEEAEHIGSSYVGTEHMLLGLIRENEGVAAQVLKKFGVELQVVREETKNLLGGCPGHSGGPCMCKRKPEPKRADESEKVSMFIYGLIMAGVPVPTILQGVENMKGDQTCFKGLEQFCDDVSDAVID